MAKKDKFSQMKQSGGVSSFQETLVQAATTVAAIERQRESTAQQASSSAAKDTASSSSAVGIAVNPQEAPRFMRLPNPQIPMQEYNLVSNYCTQFSNMTRQDFVELAIIEKLHAAGVMPQEDYDRRHAEITSRPPRGQRKGTKQTSK